MLKMSSISRLFLLSALLLIPSAVSCSERADISLRADPAYVSPNGDGIQDQAFFYPVLIADGGVSRWRLDIDHDKKGRVTRLSGAGMPALIMWDVLDRKGVVAKDGLYHARFETWGRSGHLSNEDRFFVDTTPPDVRLTVSTAPFQLTSASTMPVSFQMTAFDASPIDRWQLQIMDQTGRTVSLFWSTGPVRAVDWNGQDRQTHALVASGIYRSAFQVWDAAGNQSEPAFADVLIESEREMSLAKDDLKRISVRFTKAGDFVALRSEEMFGYRHGKVVMVETADVPVSEVAAWVNSRPGGTVILEGYSNAYKNPGKDRDLGSRYAWLVYSRLVKDDDVKASRIRVEGHGGQASLRHKKSGVGAIGNGVEVWLLDESAAGE